MKITKEEIESLKTKNGGWTRKVLAGWGVPWPPPRGWKKALIAGRPICKNGVPHDIVLAILDGLPKKKRR